MYGSQAIVVGPADWVAGLAFARDELGCTYFDWLSAVDELDDGFSVVAHLRCIPRRDALLIKTRLPRDGASLPSVTGIFAGAAWHERETAEMFGIDFPGHPHLVPLLLPDGFEGHPLRKDFVLAARAAKPWPGAKEPGESDADHARQRSPGRRKMLPPGVPDPVAWGPHHVGEPRPEAAAADVAEGAPRPRRAAGRRAPGRGRAPAVPEAGADGEATARKSGDPEAGVDSDA
jgi:NADH-quinone oxidoreductase subunit C